MKEMVYFDYTSLTPFLKPKLIQDILRFNMFKTFHANITSYFLNPKLQKIIEFTTVFLGGSPYNTPAFYSLITHTDFNLGIWYPMGGIFAFIKALETLCENHKVQILTDSAVTSVEISNNRINTVKTKNKTYNADYVVNSADYQFTETQLLEKKYQSYPYAYWKNKVMSPSAFCIYLGIKGKIKNLSHHNLYFDDSWEKHFKEVYADKKWPEHPSYYIHVPSITDPSVAPSDGDAVFILVPVAADLPDTDKIRAFFTEKIIMHLEKLIGDNFSKRIVVKKIFSHRDFIRDYNGYKGAAFGLAHTLFQSAIFRPINKSKKIDNLFYVGQYTNPGVGMPTGLISAQIVQNLIKKNE